VVVAHQRHGGGEVERFAAALQGPHGDELPEPLAPARGDGDETPEEASTQNQRLARETIAHETGQRGTQRVDPTECGADQAQLELIEAEFAFEHGKNRKDRLPIGVIEKADEPQHEHHPPLVAVRSTHR